MKKPFSIPLFIAAVGTFCIALLHIAIIIGGPNWYIWFGAGGKMADMAASGSPMAAIVTLIAAVCFAVMGLYGLSGCKLVRKLPLLRTGLVTIAAVFTLRGLGAIPMLIWYLSNPDYLPLRYVGFSITALIIGILYITGIVAMWKQLAPFRHQDI